jgi:hypothetical protein
MRIAPLPIVLLPLLTLCPPILASPAPTQLIARQDAPSATSVVVEGTTSLGAAPNLSTQTGVTDQAGETFPVGGTVSAVETQVSYLFSSYSVSRGSS